MQLFQWFFASGDAPFYFSEQLKNVSLFPNTFLWGYNFGVTLIPRLWIDYPFQLLTSLLFRIGFQWFFIDKIWWIAIAFLSFYSSFRFAESFIGRSRLRVLSALIYTTNTYALLLFDGGQVGVALAYAFFPLVLKIWFSLFDKKQKIEGLRSVVIGSVAFALLLAADLRIFYLSLVSLSFYCLFLISCKRLRIIPEFIFAPVITILIHLYWLIPFLGFRSSLAHYQDMYGNFQSLSFFSIANFTHAISLLHPNWPENLFGRVYFFRPEFLIIPFFAFGFLAIRKKVSREALFLAVFAFLGIFFAKGTQEPFEIIYELFFRYIPGFSLFRDPTKWYFLIAVSYAVLVPITVSAVRQKKTAIFLFLFFWIFSLRLLILAPPTGNYSPPFLTKDYVTLKELLSSDTSFSRVLWLPTNEQFGFSDSYHPAVTADGLFHESSVSGIIRQISLPDFPQTLQRKGIRYVVVPTDVSKRIFLDDYKFSPSLREGLLTILNTQGYTRSSAFDNLAVYDLGRNAGLFSLSSGEIRKTAWSDGIWKVDISSRTQTSILTVLYSYDSGFQLRTGEGIQKAQQSDDGFIHFSIPPGDSETIVLEYSPDYYAKYGAIGSAASLFLCSIYLILSRKQI